MQTNQIFLLFCGVLLALGLAAFFMARAKATRTRASGTAMYAQPDQYAWFSVLTTAGPAVLVGVVGAFVMLLVGAEIPTPYLLSGSLVIAAVGLLFAIVQDVSLGLVLLGQY